MVEYTQNLNKVHLNLFICSFVFIVVLSLLRIGWLILYIIIIILIKLYNLNITLTKYNGVKKYCAKKDLVKIRSNLRIRLEQNTLYRKSISKEVGKVRLNLN